MPEKQANNYRILMKKSTKSDWRRRGRKQSKYRPVSQGTIWYDGSKLRLEQLEDRRLLTGDLDFGDAPDLDLGSGPGDYRTLESDNGPRHELPDGGPAEVFMGAAVDFEADAIPDAMANGDDIDQALPDDEDGLSNPDLDLTVTVGSQPKISVRVTNTSDFPAFLTGWIDTNGNGVFEEAERGWIDTNDNDVFDDEERNYDPIDTDDDGIVDEPIPANMVGLVESQFVTLTFPTVQSGFFGSTYARFRFSTDRSSTRPTGPATDGEVEDYVAHVTIPAETRFPPSSQDVYSSSSYLRNRFGNAIASVGDLDGNGVADIAVGVPFDRTGGLAPGGVQIIFRNDDGSANITRFIPSNSWGLGELNDSDRFGESVDVVRDSNGTLVGLLVGAPGDDTGNTDLPVSLSRGAVYFLDLKVVGDSISVENHFKITSETDGLNMSEATHGFGTLVSSPGDVNGDGTLDFIVGALSGIDPSGFSHENNEIYVLLMNSDGTVLSRQILDGTLGGVEEISESWGTSLADIGDLDSDGVSELAVGDPNGGPSGTGSVDVLFLNPDDGSVRNRTRIADGVSGLSESPHRMKFGSTVASLGDLDRDGVPDLAVREDTSVEILLLNPNGSVRFRDFGAPAPLYGTIPNPIALLEDASGDGTTEFAIVERTTINGSAEIHVHSFLEEVRFWENIGFAVSPPFPDWIRFGRSLTSVPFFPQVVGVPNENTGGPERGALHFVRTFWPNSDTHVIASDVGGMGTLNDYDRFGASVASVGDLDGDGITDIVVGAPGDTGGRGAVHVLYMTMDAGTPLVKFASKLDMNTGPLSSLHPSGEFGSSLSSIGDINGDSVDDLVVGSANMDGAGPGLHILFMNDDFTVASIQPLDSNTGGVGNVHPSWGSSVAGLGDVDGDGIPDLAVGAPLDRNENIPDDSESGMVDVLFMKRDGKVRDIVTIGNDLGGLPNLGDRSLFGTSVASIGDMDGDGVPDLAVGGHTNVT